MFVQTVTGLIYGQSYYYRSFATNIYGTTWAADSTHFKTLKPAGVGLFNLSVSNISSTTAVIQASFCGGAAIYDVDLFWGETDGGTNAVIWSNRFSFGSFTNVASTNLSRLLAGLATDTLHAFTFRATNCVETLWVQPSESFRTQGGGLLGENAGGPTNIGIGTADFQGALLTGGAANATFFFGRSDGGANTSMWASAIPLGAVNEGPFSASVSGLWYGVSWYYRTYVTNPFGLAWAPTTEVFKTLNPGGTLSIETKAASALTRTSAVLNADLRGLGAVFDVTVHYGPSDEGTNALAWPNAVSLGSRTNVRSRIEHALSGLTQNSLYYFTWRATNCALDLWGAVQPFATDTDASGFAHTSKISFCGYTLSGDLTNFPALVVLNSGINGFNYSDFTQPAGGDLRFFDAGMNAQLSHEIETWNPGGDSYVWVQVPLVSGSNTCVIAAWGKAGISNQVGLRHDAWSESYLGVWHLDEDNDDSSLCLNHMTNMGTVDAPVGRIAGAQEFAGVGDRLVDEDGEKYINGLTAFTVSGWVRSDLINTDRGILIGQDPVGGDRVLTFRYDDTGALSGANDVIKAGVWVDGVEHTVESTAGRQVMAWQHITMTWERGQTISLFVDGVRDALAGQQPALSGSISDADKFVIGQGAKDVGGTLSWDGLIDEVRLASGVRGSNWIHASWLNVASNQQFICYDTAPVPTG
ncbi:MAG: LamG-like jellyroll fold domain-containing protein, partial [Verrucomicrobiota bacterium]